MQHPTYLCAVSNIHDESVGHREGSDEAPPTHPHTAASTGPPLKRSAGLDGPDVGSGERSSTLYVTVGSGPAHGKACEMLKAALSRRMMVDNGISKMFIAMAGRGIW